MELNRVKIESIKGIILSSDREEVIKEKLSKYHASEIADALEQLDRHYRKRIYRILGTDWTTEIFTHLDNEADYLQELPIEEAATILANMEVDDALDLLEDIDNKEYKDLLLAQMDESFFKDIRFISSFPQDMVGHLMTTNFVFVKNTEKITEAMKSVISQAEDKTNVNTVFVVNRAGQYAGAFALKDLVIARKEDTLKEITKINYPSVYASDKISNVIERLKEYTEDFIPVLNADREIVGILTPDDIVRAVHEEFGDDYAKLAGLSEKADLNETLKESLRKRLPWLILLLGLGMGVSSVVGLFESIVAQIAIIVSFQSLILDMAGNVGTQSLAVTIRVLMDKDISGKTKFAFVLKEMRIGFANGLILGTLSFTSVGVFLTSMKGYSAYNGFMVSGCVGLALLLAMTIASLVGTIVPMFFHKIKIDPAVASGPLITTVSDLTAVITYYTLAGLLLLEINL